MIIKLNITYKMDGKMISLNNQHKNSASSDLPYNDLSDEINRLSNISSKKKITFKCYDFEKKEFEKKYINVLDEANTKLNLDFTIN